MRGRAEIIIKTDGGRSIRGGRYEKPLAMHPTTVRFLIAIYRCRPNGRGIRNAGISLFRDENRSACN